MAAAYLFHIAIKHPFIDGNKRTGPHAARLPEIERRRCRQRTASVDVTLAVAEGRMNKSDLAAVLSTSRSGTPRDQAVRTGSHIQTSDSCWIGVTVICPASMSQ